MVSLPLDRTHCDLIAVVGAPRKPSGVGDIRDPRVWRSLNISPRRYNLQQCNSLHLALPHPRLLFSRTPSFTAIFAEEESTRNDSPIKRRGCAAVETWDKLFNQLKRFFSDWLGLTSLLAAPKPTTPHTNPHWLLVPATFLQLLSGTTTLAHFNYLMKYK